MLLLIPPVSECASEFAEPSFDARLCVYLPFEQNNGTAPPPFLLASREPHIHESHLCVFPRDNNNSGTDVKSIKTRNYRVRFETECKRPLSKNTTDKRSTDFFFSQSVPSNSEHAVIFKCFPHYLSLNSTGFLSLLRGKFILVFWRGILKVSRRTVCLSHSKSKPDQISVFSSQLNPASFCSKDIDWPGRIPNSCELSVKFQTWHLSNTATLPSNAHAFMGSYSFFISTTANLSGGRHSKNGKMEMDLYLIFFAHVLMKKMTQIRQNSRQSDITVISVSNLTSFLRCALTWRNRPVCSIKSTLPSCLTDRTRSVNTVVALKQP